MNNRFAVEHLTYRYSKKKQPAVDDLSLVVEKGSFVCIIGPNGSGKTTLVKLLTDILKPTEGTIEKSSEYSALVFQNPENQFVSNIVEEDVAFGPENLCFPPEEIRKTVDESLNRVDMLDQKEMSISSLSGGEKQRVAIAGALALSSDCIILDEPTSMLGRREASKIIDYIIELNREKKTTVICVTQDADLALSADRIIIMRNGKIVGDETPDNLVSRFEESGDCGIDLPEHIKLIKLLNERGCNIGIKDACPERIAEAIRKL